MQNYWRLFTLIVVTTTSQTLWAELFEDSDAAYLGTTVVHDGGFGAAPDESMVDPPFAAVPPLQVDSTITGGPLSANTSTGKAGISHYITPSTGTVRFASATGVSQFAPAGDNSAATLRIDFDVYFDPGDDSTDAVWGSYNFPLSGFVAPEGFVQFILDMRMIGTDEALANTVFDHSFHRNWYHAEPGAFMKTLSEVAFLGNFLGHTSGNITTEYTFEVVGFIEFRAKNDGGPTFIEAPKGIDFMGDDGTLAVPEPSTLVLLGGLAIIAHHGRRFVARRSEAPNKQSVKSGRNS